MDGKMVITAKPEDVKADAKYSALNKLGFVRAESAAYQWYLLVPTLGQTPLYKNGTGACEHPVPSSWTPVR